MTLNGTSPFQKPIIDPGKYLCPDAWTGALTSTSRVVGFLNNEFDMYTLRYAFKQVRSFVEGASPIKDIVLARVGAQVGVETDDEIDEFHRSTVYVISVDTPALHPLIVLLIAPHSGPLWHPMSTCQMTKNGSTDGVVNPSFQVKGISNLRVVDASIFVSTESLLSNCSC